MAKKDPGKNLNYRERRALGIYDAPDHKGAPGNASTTSESTKGLGAPQAASGKK